MRTKRLKSAHYDVGYGRPPKRFQFKPGRSGNPTGAKRRNSSLEPDLKALLERALRKTVKLRRGEHQIIISKAAAGIERLVSQFANGDRYARRDVVALADKLGVDLTAGQPKTIQNALMEVLSAEDEALLADYVRRHGGGHNRRDDRTVVQLNRRKNSQELYQPHQTTIEELES